MAVYAVGDVQGCYDELRGLLDRLRFDPGRDRLWLTGDLVNRGPDSLRTLRFVRELGQAAVTVLGNHDLHLLAIAAGRSGRVPDRATRQVLAAGDSDELLDWLASRPLLHRDRRLDWTMVHAGLVPEWTLDDAESCSAEVAAALAADPGAIFAGMYGNEPRHWSTGLAGMDRLRFIINCLTRLRYVDADGNMLPGLKEAPASAPAGAIPWFRHQRRASRGARIVFGHWSTLGYLREAGAMCLDAGCVWGGSLCAARLDLDQEPELFPCAGHRRPGKE
jgi:bis(5'-nucleosyl)-tetraphosphatase (symmetrical)